MSPLGFIFLHKQIYKARLRSLLCYFRLKERVTLTFRLKEYYSIGTGKKHSDVRCIVRSRKSEPMRNQKKQKLSEKNTVVKTANWSKRIIAADCPVF